MNRTDRYDLGNALMRLRASSFTHDDAERAVTQFEAEARALWAVRVLDAWAARELQAGRTAEYALDAARADNGQTSWAVHAAGLVGGCAYTPDAARIAAATALVAADPSLDPDGGK